MRTVAVLLLVLVLFSCPVRAAEPPPAVAPTWSADATVTVTAAVVDAEARPVLKWRKARKLGVTIKNIMPIVLDLQSRGEWNVDDPAGNAQKVRLQFLSDPPERFVKAVEADPAAIDWDAIMQWITEVLIPLIMLIINMFAQDLDLLYIGGLC